MSTARKEQRRPRYDISEAEVRILAAELVAQNPLGPKPFSIYLLEGSDPLADIGRWVEEHEFDRRFDMTVEVMESEYCQYEDASHLLTVLYHGTAADELPQIAGALRLITGNRLKAVEDTARYWGEDAMQALNQATNYCRRTGDVATMAIHPQFRRPRGGAWVLLMLCYGLHELSLQYGLEHWVSTAEDGVKDGLESLGVRVVDLGSSQDYLGTPGNTPIYMPVADQAAWLVQRKPRRGELITSSHAIDEFCNVDPAIRRSYKP